jgi:putative ABC transport system substrate-binding protein
MKRRRPIERALATLLLPIALTLLLVCSSWAQPPAMRRVGVLTSGGRSLAPVLEGLRQGLAQLGYVEGKQITLIVEDTKMEALDPVKAVMRLLEIKPDLIVTVSTSQTVAAKQVAGNLPIVFTVVADPVRLSLVASYASSKNNLTGVATDTASLSGKRLELLKEMFPSVRRALVVVSTKETAAQISFRFLEETAKKLDIQLIRRDVATKAELEKALLDSPKGSVDAIIHLPSNLLRNSINLLIDKAIKDKLPLSVHEESMVREGALVSYGNDFRLMGVQAAKIVAKVLKGVQPSEIPIETPERPVLVVNRTTAKAIGLKIPNAFLEQVDRIVE